MVHHEGRVSPRSRSCHHSTDHSVDSRHRTGPALLSPSVLAGAGLSGAHTAIPGCPNLSAAAPCLPILRRTRRAARPGRAAATDILPQGRRGAGWNPALLTGRDLEPHPGRPNIHSVRVRASRAGAHRMLAGAAWKTLATAGNRSQRRQLQAAVQPGYSGGPTSRGQLHADCGEWIAAWGESAVGNPAGTTVRHGAV